MRPPCSRMPHLRHTAQSKTFNLGVADVTEGKRERTRYLSLSLSLLWCARSRKKSNEAAYLLYEPSGKSLQPDCRARWRLLIARFAFSAVRTTRRRARLDEGHLRDDLRRFLEIFRPFPRWRTAHRSTRIPSFSMDSPKPFSCVGNQEKGHFGGEVRQKLITTNSETSVRSVTTSELGPMSSVWWNPDYSCDQNPDRSFKSSGKNVETFSSDFYRSWQPKSLFLLPTQMPWQVIYMCVVRCFMSRLSFRGCWPDWWWTVCEKVMIVSSYFYDVFIFCVGGTENWHLLRRDPQGWILQK